MRGSRIVPNIPKKQHTIPVDVLPSYSEKLFVDLNVFTFELIPKIFTISPPTWFLRSRARRPCSLFRSGYVCHEVDCPLPKPTQGANIPRALLGTWTVERARASGKILVLQRHTFTISRLRTPIIAWRMTHRVTYFRRIVAVFRFFRCARHPILPAPQGNPGWWETGGEGTDPLG